MKRYAIFLSVIFSFLFFLTVSAKDAEAGLLKFDKTSYTVNTGETVGVGIVVDAGSDSISSIDAHVLYDSSILEASSVSQGTFFPTVSNNITSTRVYVAGLVDDPATSKTGSGTVATISFKALKAGTVTLSYNCGQSSENSQVIKNDINATNVIVCSSNGSATVTVSGSATIAPTSTPSATTPTTPTPSVLPATGVFENMVSIALPGIVLVLVGGVLKFFLKF